MSDYIKREDALLICDGIIDSHADGSKQRRLIGNAFSNFKQMVEDIPAADVVERKVGRWELKPHKMMIEAPCCSVCGAFEPVERKYCPNCGARMEVDE